MLSEVSINTEVVPLSQAEVPLSCLAVFFWLPPLYESLLQCCCFGRFCGDAACQADTGVAEEWADVSEVQRAGLSGCKHIF